MQVLFLLTLVSRIIFRVKATNYASQSSTKAAPGENKDAEKSGDFNDAELTKIVAEIPLDDPLNAFYDPQEPYRLSNYAYWRPITYPEVHENPPLPTGFIPPNAPPRSLPSDFFNNDDEARKIVLSEHGAAFCPFLRRWREKHPLKAYPIGPDFIHRHPPIKFTSGKGYDIDLEMNHIKRLSQTIEQEVLGEYATKLYNGEIPLNAPKSPTDNVAAPSSGVENILLNEAAEIPEDLEDESQMPQGKDPFAEFGFLLKIVGEVKKVRLDCRETADFTKIIVAESVYYSYPPSCLLEVIFRLEEMEDIHSPLDHEHDSSEIANKPEYFRQVLMRLTADEDEDGLNPGKCPFGFGKSKNKNKKKKKKETKKSNSKPYSQAHSIYPKIYRGTIPEWAKLGPDERIFSTDDDSEVVEAEKYLFSYKQVPFPSIQDTLKKYVGL